MEALYFAYGSNLSSSRMQARVSSAFARGPACLPGYRLTLDKRSRDGSGKANLRVAETSRVYGVLYRISAIHWAALDACEPGYRRIPVTVESRGQRCEVQTYLSRVLAPHPVAYDWYKRLIVEGAIEHDLPAGWRHRLEALPARRDPRR